jgi:hypothetical protein
MFDGGGVAVSAPCVAAGHHRRSPPINYAMSSQPAHGVVPTRAVDALVADDAASAVYAPATAQADLLLPEHIRSKRDYLFRELVVASGVPPWSVHVDDVALYSVTESRAAGEMTGALFDALTASFGAGGAAAAARAHVIDACACVGGNALSFAQRFAHVEAYELSPQRARLLAHNGRALRLAVTLGAGFSAASEDARGGGGATGGSAAGVGGGAAVRRMTVHCADFAGVVSATTGRAGLVADAVFFDPPWGGPSYGDSALIDMSLGASDICDLSAALLAHPLRARIVALKAPLNFNTARLTTTLSSTAPGSRVVRTITKKNMQLIIIAASQALVDSENRRAAGEGPRREGAAGGLKRPRPNDDEATGVASSAAAGSAGPQKWTPSGREAAAPPAGAIAVALEAVDGGRRTGLFLRAAPTGAIILSRDPEVLFVSGGTVVALRTVFHGIVRGSRTTLRAMCRSERPPAPVGPDDTEKWVAVRVAGRGEGGVALKLPSLSVFMGSAALTHGASVELVKLPTETATAAAAAAGSPTTPLFFRPVFRDALGPVLGGSSMSAPAEAAVLSAFGVHFGGRVTELPRLSGSDDGASAAKATSRAAALAAASPSAVLLSDRDDDFLLLDALPAPETDETRALLLVLSASTTR